MRWPGRFDIRAARPWLVLDCAHNPASARAFYRPDGSDYPVGEVLRQPDLAWTLANFASGVMILLYRPFDTGDLIECAGGEPPASPIPTPTRAASRCQYCRANPEIAVMALHTAMASATMLRRLPRSAQ